MRGRPNPPPMLGSLVTSLSQRVVRMATMAMMLGGAGVAGTSIYVDQITQSNPQAGTVLAYFKDHAQLFLIIGAIGVVVGGILNFMLAQRMKKKMMGGMGMGGMGMGGGMPAMAAGPGMGGLGGMGGMPPGMNMQQMMSQAQQVKDVVKVRCKSCSSLELEAATFCSKCGKTLA